MLDWIVFGSISDFFDQLRKSWESDFVPSFLIGFRVFLLLLLCVLIVVLAILFAKGVRWLHSGRSKDKGGKGEAKSRNGGEDKKK